MRENLKKIAYAAVMLGAVGCAGVQRNCSSGCASAMGADWVVVQTTMDGAPFRCWKLRDVSVANEENSDGIYWQSPDGHLVHLSNNYIRVQVANGQFAVALAEIGLTDARCEALANAALPEAR